MLYLLTTNGYENTNLYEAARRVLDGDVMLINPESVFYRFGNFPNVMFYNGVSLAVTPEDRLIVRSSGNARNIFGKVCAGYGVGGDPYERFTTERIPKMNSEVIRYFTNQNKPTSYFAFNFSTIRAHKQLFSYPVIYKPVIGNHGNGMQLIEHEEQMLRVASSHNYNDGRAIFFQEKLHIIREFRVITFNKQILNWSKKVLSQSRLFSGRRFIEVEELPTKIVEYIALYAKDGLIGMDIVILKNGSVYILEQNRAPEFEHVDRTTGLNTAELIIRSMYA